MTPRYRPHDEDDIGDDHDVDDDDGADDDNHAAYILLPQRCSSLQKH